MADTPPGLVKAGIYTTNHHSYHIEGMTDLTPTRDQAERRRKDTRHPEGTVIHFHKQVEDCEGHNHEIYNVGSTSVIESRP